MEKLKWAISFLLASSLIGLAGCSLQTSKEKVAHATEKQEKKMVKKDEPKKQEEEKPVFINIIDPSTKTVIKTISPKDMGFKTDVEKYKAEIAKMAKDFARGTKDSPGYDKRMILDKLDANGQVIKGTPQTILDEDELTEKILQLSETGGDVEVPLYVTASGYKVEDVSHLGETVVASYTTHFNSGIAGRSKNIALSAAAINNIIIGVQDSFSYNTTVGPSDAAHGYQKAPEIQDGKLVDGYGGGICQTSSTLYNAIDQLAVSYIEKHHHSLHVGYVPEGRDATVSYGGKDFRFKNTTGVPIVLKAIVKKGSLTVEVRTSNAYKSLIKKAI
ncbi:VanW family protein [Neobacillus bataviensis]|uniref:VanW family protein n=1 Tax=Neobacillus bataviensis TaxID=220685 RepID=UPI001CBAEE36|nr:VanW family protein [Neobacillus bataviensis]